MFEEASLVPKCKNPKVRQTPASPWGLGGALGHRTLHPCTESTHSRVTTGWASVSFGIWIKGHSDTCGKGAPFLV